MSVPAFSLTSLITSLWARARRGRPQVRRLLVRTSLFASLSASLSASLFASLFAIGALNACSSLYYLPRIQKVKLYDPAKNNIVVEDVEIEVNSDQVIHGWWFASKGRFEDSKGTFVYFHGNAENLSSHFMNLSWLPAAEYNYLIIDYPGYGVSPGEPSPQNTVESGIAAVRWVHQKKDARHLIIYGQSLGGIIAYRVALDIQSEIPIRALVLDSTFLSYRSLARQKVAANALTWILQPFAWLVMSDRYAPQHLESRGSYPLLVAHGDEDTVIPFHNGEQIYQKSKEPKTFWKISGGIHGDLFWRHNKIYRQKLLEWLSQVESRSTSSTGAFLCDICSKRRSVNPSIPNAP